jgi:hypothetical protein
MLNSKSSLNIREGIASQVLPPLSQQEDTVLVFISKDGNAGANRRRFTVLRQVAERIDTLIAKRGEEKWNALVEALTPDVELSQNRLVEAEMLADARRIILESGDFVKASAIAGAADFSSKNPSSQPNRWKRNGQIFAIHYKGVDLYPSYALDHSSGVRPFPDMTAILAMLADKDEWQKAFWFESPNSYLNNRQPKSLLRSQSKDVLRAAEIEAVGVQHG